MVDTCVCQVEKYLNLVNVSPKKKQKKKFFLCFPNAITFDKCSSPSIGTFSEDNKQWKEKKLKTIINLAILSVCIEHLMQTISQSLWCATLLI